MAGQRCAYRGPQSAGAFPMDHAEPSDARDGGVVQITVEHGERFVRSRAAQIELQRNAGRRSADHRAIRTDRLGRLWGGPELHGGGPKTKGALRNAGPGAAVDPEQSPRLGEPP